MSLVLPFLGLLLALTADDVAFQNEELLHLPRAHEDCELNGLTGSERYQYQVSVRRPGDVAWMLRDLHGFSTLKEPDQRVRFDYVLSSPDASVDGSVLLSYTVGGR